jgi:hypothetical protein
MKTKFRPKPQDSCVSSSFWIGRHKGRKTSPKNKRRKIRDGDERGGGRVHVSMSISTSLETDQGREMMTMLVEEESKVVV